MRFLANAACPACGSMGLQAFHDELGIPTNSCLLLPSLAEAKGFPTGNLRLALCPHCGFITNVAFDAGQAEYSSRYEETQGFSPRFVAFARDLAKRWVETYDLAGKTVLEIGCGKGEFLVMMIEAGAGAGVGIDPGVHPERYEGDGDGSVAIDASAVAAAKKVRWIADFYSEAYTDIAADAVVCRHTLEHIQPVGDFMRMVRRSIGDRLDTVVLFELPDVERVLREVAFWDVYYEHTSYFSLGSLARLFRATGFEVLHLELDYDDQYLLIEARPSATTPAPGEPFPVEADLGALEAGAAAFAEGYATILDRWRTELAEVAARGGRSVIWGAGSKGVSFLTNLGRDCPVEYAVDINPNKWGMFMAGTGQEIVAPEFCVDYRPELVVVMNPVYVDEITAQLAALGVTDARVVAV
jgi:hypothetical protein